VGLDFECQPGDIIIIDEADKFFCINPDALAAKLKQNACICLTATPGESEIEKQVVDALGFKVFNGHSQ
jgi:hypothetical protein